jgi:flagellar basal-body rod protein FlgB
MAARETLPMPISDIPIFSMLRTRMQWHQERQRVLAENVSNADTPRFQPRDLSPPTFDSMRPAATNVGLTRTSTGHIDGSTASSSRFALDRRTEFDARPSGNSVSLEDEMMKVASNAMDYQAAAAIYTRGLGLIKAALGKR